MSFDRRKWLEQVLESSELTIHEKAKLACLYKHLEDAEDAAEARRRLTDLVGAELAWCPDQGEPDP